MYFLVTPHLLSSIDSSSFDYDIKVHKCLPSN